MSHPTDAATPTQTGTLQFVARHERALWAFAIAALVADIALTTYGLANGAVELNPLAAWVIAEYHVLGMTGLKLGGVAIAVFGRLLIPDEFGALVPLALGVPWALASLINVFTIASL
ncbi:DUF5658 family protein [Halomarina oriensis]|uniref:DUF5658 domain-containing protein n=1 Tax=Halomarina oriensis TaxID=671145 RepID=A0A6B0GHI4_9EURY|nr:DUF5658 family protein [Halomarina oriensis]MWG33241.1 hypothetical protein [Halomarina oriensis]